MLRRIVALVPYSTSNFCTKVYVLRRISDEGFAFLASRLRKVSRAFSGGRFAFADAFPYEGSHLQHAVFEFPRRVYYGWLERMLFSPDLARSSSSKFQARLFGENGVLAESLRLQRTARDMHDQR